jgi:hypothetical protein
MASHTIEKSGEGRVRIKNLELFMGFDPSIDSDDDESMKQYDNGRVKDIVQRTGKFIKRGSRPKLVIEHEKDGKTTRPEAVGDITSVRYEERNGVAYVVGDVEMPKEAFESLLATNAFPRRSAEIWKDNHLSEVALLGRDTPRRPLPDTQFTKQGSKMVFERPLGVVALSIDSKDSFGEMVGVGGGLNTFIPTADSKRNNMARKNKKKMEAENEEIEEVLDEQAADEMPKLDEDESEMAYRADAAAIESDEDEDEFCDVESEKVKYEEDDDMEDDDEENFADGVHVDIGSHQGEAEEEDEEEMEAAYGGKAKMSKGDKSTKALFARVQELEKQLKLERFGKEVDSMIRDGYRCSKFRNSMVEELSDAANPGAKIAFWKATMARLPLNVPTVAQHTVTDEGGETLDPKVATARAVHEAAGDLAKFKQLFAKYTGQKA